VTSTNCQHMKRFAICISLFLTLSGLASGAQRKIAFERGDNVWIANLDGSDAKKVAAGSLPDISPDATRLAFNTDEDSKTRPGPERHIAIADLASGKATVLKDISSDNCFGPVWSPDGNKIAFSIMADKEWHLGLVNADGSGFRFVKNAGLKSDAFGEPAWARDGKSIFCHDLDNLYHIDLDGNVLKKWQLSKVLTEAGMSGNNRLSVSPNGKTLLMDVDVGADHERKNWDGPQPAVYMFDFDTEKTTRVTAKDDFVWDPCWLTNDEFLCLIQKERENEPSLYRMPLNGKKPKLLVKHARTPSPSAPQPSQSSGQ
jgi:TolB protein